VSKIEKHPTDQTFRTIIRKEQTNLLVYFICAITYIYTWFVRKAKPICQIITLYLLEPLSNFSLTLWPMTTLVPETSFLELIIQQSPDLICRYSLDKKIVFINETVHRMGGQKPKHYIGKSIHDFGYPTDFVATFEAGFDRCVAQQTPETIQIAVTVGAFAPSHFAITFVPIQHPQEPNHMLGVFTISRDVSKDVAFHALQKNKIDEFQIMSQRLIRKANKLQEFAYIVSHNLRAPMSNMASLLHLYEQAEQGAEKEEIFRYTLKAFYHLSQTIEDLTQVVQVNQHFEVHTETLRFQQLFERIRHNIHANIVETRTQIECDFEACPTVVYNKAYLESIMQNLITNAIKYRHPERDPLVVLQTKSEQGVVYLSCADNGTGIDLERHGQSVFGLHKTFHGNQDARGVGLYITKSQIEALGGRIAVASSVGIGTTFTIQLTPHPDDTH